MDRRLRRPHKPVLFKDRGDGKKEQSRKKVDSEAQVNNSYMGNDRGDSPDKLFDKNRESKQTLNKPEKARNTQRDSKVVLEKNPKKVQEKMRTDVKPLDMQRRRKLAEMYTFRKSIESVAAPAMKKEESKQDSIDNIFFIKYEPKNKKQATEEVKKDKTEPPPLENIEKDTDKNAHRKPIIKTVTCKNDSTKVYKAVTFVDQTRKVTPLKIKIPNKMPSPPKSISPDSLKSKSTSSSSREKSASNRKIKIRRKRYSSPELGKDKPLVTEVAKWDPQSVNQHTKPYYEAWVDTTLTAFSRQTDDEKLLLERQALLDSVKKAMEPPMLKPSSAELKDEKYTGRIRIKHKLAANK